MKLFIAAMALFVVTLHAGEIVARHNEGGSAGSNGVKQLVAIKLNKLLSFKDSATIQLDLGDHRYSSNKPDELITQRPLIMLTIGSVPTMTGTANSKGVIVGEQFTAKLVAHGAGIKIAMKRQNLSALLSDLSGKGEHAFLTITIQDNHLPSGTMTGASSRHAGVLFTMEFELDIEENTRNLLARGG